MKQLIVCTAVLVALSFSARAGEVKETYEKVCAKCHGNDGKGDTKMGKKLDIKDLTDAKVQAELKDEAAFKAIKEGVKKGDKTLMKPTENVTETEIKALVAYVRTLKKK